MLSRKNSEGVGGKRFKLRKDVDVTMTVCMDVEREKKEEKERRIELETWYLVPIS